MNLHKNARLTPRGRVLLVQRMLQGLRAEEAAQAAGVSVRTAYKWLRRYREEGEAGMLDRSSRPHTCPHATPEQALLQLIEKRKARYTYQNISQELGIAISTVARLLQRLGLNRLPELEPAPPIRRYEYAQPGDMLHLDIKKLARFWRPGHRITGTRAMGSDGAGWEYVHVAIDDASRIAFSSVHANQKGVTACKALLQAVRYYRSLNIRFIRVMTDNGSCYLSGHFRRLCRRLGLRHIRIKPYTPRTNGKAERFIQTSLREWAYARSYESSEQRTQHLVFWLHHYNWHRPHSSLSYCPPISRISLNNLPGLHN